MKRFLSILTLWLCILLSYAQGINYSFRYFDDNHGLSHGRITKIAEDANGMIWIATWNGLNRFDGEQFVSFKSQPGDGIVSPGYRFRDILWDEDGRLLCKIEDRVLAFDTRTYHFDTLTSEREQQVLNQMDAIKEEVTRKKAGIAQSPSRQIGSQILTDIQRDFHDSKGNRWLVDSHGFYIASPICERGTLRTSTEARAVRQMSNGDIWVAERELKQLAIYNSQWERQKTLLHAPIYSIYEATNGDVFLGQKPGCAIRIHQGVQSFIEGVEDVYDITEDKQGRYWMASFKDGIYCWDGGQVKHVSDNLQARRLWLMDDGTLMAATVNGLWVMDNIYSDKPTTYLHSREANRATSLASNAVMDIIRHQEKLFLALGTSGIDELQTSNLADSGLVFSHTTIRNGLSSDIVYQVIPWQDNRLLLQRNNGLSIFSPEDGHILNFDRSFFGRDMHMGEVRPLILQDSTLLISTSEGLLTIHPAELQPSNQKLRIAICSLVRSNSEPDYTVDAYDTIRLTKNERSIAIRFIAINYSNDANILYRTRLQQKGGKETAWSAPSTNHEVTIQDLAPGEYCFSIESTNAEGHWTGNYRTITLLVAPTFVESTLGRVLIASILLLLLTAIIYFAVLTHTLHAKRQETLDAYLELQERIRRLEPDTTPTVLAPGLNSRDEQFINHLRQFVEQNMSNSDVLVDDMAHFVGMSRSTLAQKIRQLFNLSPADFLREARIKHACELLRTTDMQMKEIAYACGFSDPKYFTKCFKQSTGKTPSQYKG